jgi:lathosterol oxidase
MEFFLDLADDYVFDKLYAKVLPATSFLPAAVQQASSAAAANGTAAAATVKSLLSYVPHPPLPSAESLEGLSAWPRDYMPRQYISLVRHPSSPDLPLLCRSRSLINLHFGDPSFQYLMVFAGILLMYPSMAGFSYYYIFDHRMMKHPRFLKNQVRQEIIYSLQAFPWLILMTTPWFVYEVRGGGLFYDKVADYGWAYLAFSIPLFLVFTDFCIYWIHRIEHHPALYKHVHKPHHKWIGAYSSDHSSSWRRRSLTASSFLLAPVPTPWAAFAFHPIDGYVQSLPYHIFPMIFPLHKKLYVGRASPPLSCFPFTPPPLSFADPPCPFSFVNVSPSGERQSSSSSTSGPSSSTTRT